MGTGLTYKVTGDAVAVETLNMVSVYNNGGHGTGFIFNDTGDFRYVSNSGKTDMKPTITGNCIIETGYVSVKAGTVTAGSGTDTNYTVGDFTVDSVSKTYTKYGVATTVKAVIKDAGTNAITAPGVVFTSGLTGAETVEFGAAGASSGVNTKEITVTVSASEAQSNVTIAFTGENKA